MQYVDKKVVHLFMSKTVGSIVGFSFMDVRSRTDTSTLQYKCESK